MATPAELLSDVQQKAIADDYLAGKKLRTIEEQHDVARSTIYWVLQRQGVAPQRTKPKSRLNLDIDDPQLLRKLYEVIDAQDQRIRDLEAALTEALAALDAFAEHVGATATVEEAKVMREVFMDRLAEIEPKPRLIHGTHNPSSEGVRPDD